MPLYDYECSGCGHSEEISQKFSEKELSKCPACNKGKFRRVILNPPMAFIKGDAKTVAQLADRNTKKMGKYELQDREQADNIEERKSQKNEQDFRKKLNSLTSAQTKNYIEKGKLP